MHQDDRYEVCLAAGLTMIDFLQSNPGAPPHELLSVMIFIMLYAWDRYEEERGDRRAVEFSAN